MGALLAWAIHWHWKGGLVAAVALSLADLLPRAGRSTRATTATSSCVLIGGPIVGYMCESLQRMARRAGRGRARRRGGGGADPTGPRRARRRAAGADDGAAPGRRAPAGEWAELGRLAGEQERGAALADPAAGHGAGPVRRPGRPRRRARGDGHRAPGAGRGGDAGRRRPGRRARRRPRPSPRSGLPRQRAAPTSDPTPARGCWPRPLPTRSPSRCATTVPASPPGRLEEAAAEGRLGVASSIRGRIEDLGGTATRRRAATWGTEWELTVPLA